MQTEAHRPKVAFINQPWSVIVPPMQFADSIGIWTDEVARRLSDTYQVISYSRRGSDQSAEQNFAGVHYRRFAAPLDRAVRFLRLLDEWKLINPRRGFTTSRWFYWQYYSRTADDLFTQQPDIVHIQNFSQFVPVVRARLPRAKIVLHMHSQWLTEYSHALIMPRIEKADAVIACSNYFADSIRAGWPQWAGKCRTIYNGVDIGEFAQKPLPARSGRRILFVGRVCPEKGVHVLVQAFARVAERFPNAELSIVGPVARTLRAFSVNVSAEPAVRELERWYRRPFVRQLMELIPSGIRNRVRITGEVSRKTLVEHYRTADLLVLPSIYAEGFGIPIVEAAAAELPTVATRRGGMPEVIVDGKTGLLIEPGSVRELEQAICRLLADPAERLAMGIAARNRAAAHFTWDQIALALHETYQELMRAPLRAKVLSAESAVTREAVITSASEMPARTNADTSAATSSI